MKLADNQIELLQAVQQPTPTLVVIVSAGVAGNAVAGPLQGAWFTAPSAAGAGAMVDV